MGDFSVKNGLDLSGGLSFDLQNDGSSETLVTMGGAETDSGSYSQNGGIRSEEASIVRAEVGRTADTDVAETVQPSSGVAHASRDEVDTFFRFLEAKTDGIDNLVLAGLDSAADLTGLAG